MLDADMLQCEGAGEGDQPGGENQICTYLINVGMASATSHHQPGNL